MLISSDKSITLDREPSCLEFVPGHPQYAIVGTYTLNKDATDQQPDDEAQKRTGSLIVVKSSQESLTVEQSLSTDDGILDLHFSPHEVDVFCTADSAGRLAFHRVVLGDAARISAGSVRESVTEDDRSVLALSLQWHPTRPDVLAVTLSSGDVVLVTVAMAHIQARLSDMPLVDQEAPILTSRTVVGSHTLEAWTVAFTPDGGSMLSGGDDCVLQYVPMPAQDTPAVDHNVGWRNRKIHGAGVTAILPLSGSTFLTGSYDDHIRLAELAANGRPRVAAELDLGGGVWRLKLLSLQWTAPDDESCACEAVVLASCMYAGARLVKIVCNDKGVWSIEVVHRFEEHQSMNYGSDCIYDARSRSWMVISTSFYDRLCCRWTTSSDA